MSSNKQPGLPTEVSYNEAVEAVEKICVAGLLTYFRYERLPNSRQWHKRIAQSVLKLTAAGLSGICTRFPFNPFPQIAKQEQCMGQI